MARSWLPALLASLVLTAPAPVQEKKDSPDPNAVDVRFTDGSTVRMVILQDNLEVVTKYGKLTIPASEIRRIEFAFRPTEEATRKVQAALKDLGHDLHLRREAATKELVAIGLAAVPELQKALKSSNPEVANRAAIAYQQISEKVPGLDQIRFLDNDLIQTVEFPISGRIVNPSIKAQSPYFGDVQLQVGDMRLMRWLVPGGEAQVVVDATRYGSAPNQWMDTEVQISAQSRLMISAAGRVDLWPQGPGQYISGPNGYQASRQGQQLPGALLGKIGPNGTPFVVGERFDGTAPGDGKLYLHIVPSPWNNAATGGYEVKIVARP